MIDTCATSAHGPPTGETRRDAVTDEPPASPRTRAQVDKPTNTSIRGGGRCRPSGGNFLFIRELIPPSLFPGTSSIIQTPREGRPLALRCVRAPRLQPIPSAGGRDLRERPTECLRSGTCVNTNTIFQFYSTKNITLFSSWRTDGMTA